MDYNIKIQKHLVNITPVMENDIDKTLEHNLFNHKMTTLWKKYLKHPDAEAIVDVTIKKNSNNTYNWTIMITIPWGPTLRHSRPEYKNVLDFINNSFKQFTLQPSREKN